MTGNGAGLDMVACWHLLNDTVSEWRMKTKAQAQSWVSGTKNS